MGRTTESRAVSMLILARMALESQLFDTGNTLEKRTHSRPSTWRSPVTFSFRLVLYRTLSSSFLNPEQTKPFVQKIQVLQHRILLKRPVRRRSRHGAATIPDTSTTSVSSRSVLAHSYRGSTVAYTRRRRQGRGGAGGAAAGAAVAGMMPPC